jgi:magnesium chelatase family protein
VHESIAFVGAAYHRILKLSRTIADLAGSDEIQFVHLAEALQYRPKIMMG